MDEQICNIDEISLASTQEGSPRHSMLHDKYEALRKKHFLIEKNYNALTEATRKILLQQE